MLDSSFSNKEQDFQKQHAKIKAHDLDISSFGANGTVDWQLLARAAEFDPENGTAVLQMPLFKRAHRSDQSYGIELKSNQALWHFRSADLLMIDEVQARINPDEPVQLLTSELKVKLTGNRAER